MVTKALLIAEFPTHMKTQLRHHVDTLGGW